MAPITFGPNQVTSFALDEFNRNTRNLQQSAERLSTGLKVNRPADNSALFAVGNSLEIQRVLGQRGVRNLSDGVSATNIADAALSELTSIVTKQKELAEQAANGVLTSDQRNALNTQAQALASEYNRIVSETEFNGTKLLNGEVKGITIDTGNGADGTVEADILGFKGSVDTIVSGTGTYTTSSLNSSNQGLAMRFFVSDLDGDGYDDIVTAGGEDTGPNDYVLSISIFFGNASGTLSEDFTDSSAGSLADPLFGITVNGAGIGDIEPDGDIDIIADFSAIDTNLVATEEVKSSASAGGQSYGALQDAAVGYDDISSAGTLTGDFNGDGVTDSVTQIGFGALSLSIQDTVTTLSDAVDISQEAISLTSVTNAQEALTTLETNQETIDLVRGRVGASLSRLEAATQVTKQNYEAATNNLLDIDVAEEISNQTGTLIKQEAAAAVLAQANQIPAVAFQLLQGVAR